MGHLDFDNFIVAKYAYMLDFFRTAALQDIEQNSAVTVFAARDANTQGYAKHFAKIRAALLQAQNVICHLP